MNSRASKRVAALRSTLLSLVMIGASLSFAPRASADAEHAATPCDRLASGTPCIRDDGNPGFCERRPDPLHPERTPAICVRNEHFCDALPEGAPCPGYLGQTSHCRTVRDPTRTPPLTWHSCLSDLAIGTPLGAGLTPAARMTTPSVRSGPVDLSPPPLPDAGETAPVAPETSPAHRGCHTGLGSDGWLAIAASLAMMAVGRRRRRA